MKNFELSEAEIIIIRNLLDNELIFLNDEYNRSLEDSSEEDYYKKEYNKLQKLLKKFI